MRGARGVEWLSGVVLGCGGRRGVGGVRGDDRPEEDPWGDRRQDGQQGQALHAWPARIAVERLEVIEDPRSVEPEFLGELDPFGQFRPLELMLGKV